MSLLIESLESRQFFAATGLPDTSFGGNTAVGTVTFRSDTDNDSAVPVKLLVDSGGRSYVVAHTSDILQVRRLTREGVLDTTYANQRALIGLSVDKPLFTAASPGGVTAAMDVTDRLYLLAGTKIYRFTVSGKIDPTFGVKGVATLTGFSGARDISLDSHNRIYVSGSVAIGSGSTATQQFRVARLRSNGTVDRTFATNGIYTAPLPSSTSSFKNPSSQGQFIRVLLDDSVVAVAAGQFTQTVSGVQYLNPVATGVQSVRFTSAGQLDTSYGDHGLTQQYLGGDDVNFAHEFPVGIRADGTVVMLKDSSSADSPTPTGSTTNGLIGTDGNPRHTFAFFVGGQRHVLGKPTTFETASDGQEYVDEVVAAALYRRLSNGTVDANFTGSGGSVPITLVSDIALPSDGTLLTLGKSSKKLSLNVRRLFADATPVANLAAKPVTTSGSATFSVTYASPAGFASSAGDGSEIGVVKGGTTLHPSVVSRTVVADSIIVRYRLSDGGSPFASNDNGTYAVKLLANEIQDLASHAATARTLGSLTVAIA